jgi:signal transduction histidine kinase
MPEPGARNPASRAGAERPPAAAAARSPSILVVDDDEGLLILMSDALRGDGFEVATADSGRAAMAWLEKNRPDLAVLDLKLQDVSGPALLEQMKRREPPLPFIVVTGQGDEKVAVEVMKHGALDYVMKDTGMIDLLPAVVRRALGMVSQQKALDAAQAEQRRLEGEIVAASEHERHIIGADLHDGLGQQLTAMELMCAALKADAAPYPPLAQGLDQIGRMLREAITQTRFLARGLVPLGSGPDALQIGLTELASRTHALGRVECKFETTGIIRMPDSNVAGHLYRIAQEAVNNAVKHAQARHVTVALRRADGTLELRIADDGKGIPKTAKVEAGLGLGVMQHRAKLIGAELTIGSKRGQGVTIRCRLPWKT